MKKYIIALVIFLWSSVVSAQLLVQNGATLYLKGNAQVTLDNTDLDNNGTITTEASSRFTFVGSENAVISGTQPTTFSELEIDKSINKKLILKSHITVNGKIIFSSGLFDLGEYNANLGTIAFLENENENSRAMTTKNGQLIFTTTLNAPAAVNPANLGAIITSTRNLGTVTIKRGHNNQNNGAGFGTSILRYYDILPANNTALDATLRFQYFDAELNSLNENGLVLWKSQDNFTWTDMGLTSRNTAANYVEKNRLEDFARFTLSTTVALPVTGLTLTGRWRNGASYLSWTTLAEYNNDHFEIERKYAGENSFTWIGNKISAHADGNASFPTAYNWTDATVLSNKGPIQYRLRQVDRNGQLHYSNTIVLKPEASYVFIEKVFPTSAVENSFYIQTGGVDVQNMRVQLYDAAGRLCMDRKLEYQPQWLNVGSLSAGMYKIVLRSGDLIYTNSFIKL